MRPPQIHNTGYLSLLRRPQVVARLKPIVSCDSWVTGGEVGASVGHRRANEKRILLLDRSPICAPFGGLGFTLLLANGLVCHFEHLQI